jgi:hypothetical protein
LNGFGVNQSIEKGILLIRKAMELVYSIKTPPPQIKDLSDEVLALMMQISKTLEKPGMTVNIDVLSQSARQVLAKKKESKESDASAYNEWIAGMESSAQEETVSENVQEIPSSPTQKNKKKKSKKPKSISSTEIPPPQICLTTYHLLRYGLDYYSLLQLACI